VTKIIEKITSEQEAKIPAYIQKWVDEAARPIDREKARKCLKKIYPDNLIIFTESFDNTVKMINFIAQICGVEQAEFDSQLGEQLGEQLYAQLYAHGEQLGEQLYSQLRSHLGEQLDSQLDSQLYAQLDSQLGSQLGLQLGELLGEQLGSMLGSKIRWSYYVSYFWYAWLGWYEYGQYIGVEFDTEILKEFIEILQNAPLVVFAGNLIFVCEKPKISWENGLLHNEKDMAVKWPDGTGFYFLDGLLFEEILWQKTVKKELSFAELMQIENADQQAVALKYNTEAIIEENAELVDKSERGNELFKIAGQPINDLLDEPEIWFLRMPCPTGRTFVEGVAPETARKSLKSFQPADYCQAAALGLNLEQYNHLRMEG